MGRHSGLKIHGPKRTCGFESRPGYYMFKDGQIIRIIEPPTYGYWLNVKNHLERVNVRYGDLFRAKDYTGINKSKEKYTDLESLDKTVRFKGCSCSRFEVL